MDKIYNKKQKNESAKLDITSKTEDIKVPSQVRQTGNTIYPDRVSLSAFQNHGLKVGG